MEYFQCETLQSVSRYLRSWHGKGFVKPSARSGGFVHRIECKQNKRRQQSVQCKNQSLEFIAETRILTETKIKNIFSVGKNRQTYFFSMKIKMMDL